MKRTRLRKRCSAIALNALIAVLAILWLVPVFWLVVSSFRAEQGAYTSLNIFVQEYQCPRKSSSIGNICPGYINLIPSQ